MGNCPNCGWTSFISVRTQTALSKAFYTIGYNSYAHPWRYLLGGLIFTILCGAGLLRFTYEGDGFRLWIPTDSEIISQYNFEIDTFGNFETQAVVLIYSEEGNNMLTRANLDYAYSIYTYVTDTMSTVYKGESYDFDSLCLRDYPSYPTCDAAESSIFALFGNDPSNWESQDDIDAVIETTLAQSSLGYFVGDTTTDESTGYVTGGSVLLINFGLASTPTDDDTLYEANQAWMEEFQDYFGDFKKSSIYENAWDSDLQIAYFTSRSFNDEIARVVTVDIMIYLTTFIVMFVYLAFNLGDLSCVGARAWLAVVTLVVMLMALIAGYGLGSLCGATMNSVVFLLPYVLIGVGVDDEILILESIDGTKYPNGDASKGADRFGIAMKHCGLSISLTTFCSIGAFSIGATVTMPGVSAFCVFSLFAFLANYILQFLIFLPLFAMDEQRKVASRNFCCCCIKHESNGGYGDTSGSALMSHGKAKTYDDYSNTRGCAYILSLFKVASLMKNIIVPCLSKRRNRLILIVAFVIIFILSIVSLNWLVIESDSSRLVPDDSFTITYRDEFDAAFGNSQINVDIVLRNLDFSESSVRDSIYTIISEIEAYDEHDAAPIGSVREWLTDFDTYVADEYGVSIDDLTQSEFYSYLEDFANVDSYAEWEDDIVYDDDDNPTMIETTKFFCDFSVPRSSRDQWPTRNALKSIMEGQVGNNNGYAFYFNWAFAYFEYVIDVLTIDNIASASLGVFAILCFMMDIKMAFFIICIVVIIDVELFGWMVIFGAALDSITFLQLVMAVGLTVDYVIHITHAVADADYTLELMEEEKMVEIIDNQRIYELKIRIAMRETGVGVVKGAWTTFLGIISLAFSSSQAFRGFFTVFVGIIFVAVANGLFFVPALMGELRCLWVATKHEKYGEYDYHGKEKDQERGGVRMDTMGDNNHEQVTLTPLDKKSVDRANDDSNDNNKNEKKEDDNMHDAVYGGGTTTKGKEDEDEDEDEDDEDGNNSDNDVIDATTTDTGAGGGADTDNGDAGAKTDTATGGANGVTSETNGTAGQSADV